MSNLDRVTARRDGYRDAYITLRTILLALNKEAEQVFQLARETDPYYQDPRTDYFLGRRDAVQNLIVAANKELEKLN